MEIKKCSHKGCTCFPDMNHFSCCDAHDTCYARQQKSRLECDKKLQECVCHKSGNIIGYLMYNGVRLFGWLFWLRVTYKKSKRIKR